MGPQYTGVNAVMMPEYIAALFIWYSHGSVTETLNLGYDPKMLYLWAKSYAQLFLHTGCVASLWKLTPQASLCLSSKA